MKLLAAAVIGAALCAAPLAAARPDAADWQELVPNSGYWIDAAHIESDGEQRRFTLRYSRPGSASFEFRNSVDCRENTVDVRKFEIQDGDRLIMIFVAQAVEREMIALVCTVGG